MGEKMEGNPNIVSGDDLLLVTGATGFIGSRVVESLLGRGFRNLRCFARNSSDAGKIKALSGRAKEGAHIEVFRGNLLSREDCAAAVKDVAVVFHLAAKRGGKSFPDAFLNSVVTTRNLLEASGQNKRLKRFVNVSSFSVYSNQQKLRRGLMDESAPTEKQPELRNDPYCYAKVKQDEIVAEYGRRYGIPYVIVRPGYVYGPGNHGITGRVGIGSFGIFLHLGGPNPIPFSYVDNCADAIALAGVRKLESDGEVFNVVDDDLLSSRRFLRLYKRNVRRFSSIYLPHFMSYGLCCLWEWYSKWSDGQLEPVYNHRSWHVYWKKTNYSNAKLKSQLGWTPRVPTTEGLRRYFESCRIGVRNA
jgi:nucleoside-diphosphate-sugar epimerase